MSEVYRKPCTWPGCEIEIACASKRRMQTGYLTHLDSHIHLATYYIDTYKQARAALATGASESLTPAMSGV